MHVGSDVRPSNIRGVTEEDVRKVPPYVSAMLSLARMALGRLSVPRCPAARGPWWGASRVIWSARSTVGWAARLSPRRVHPRSRPNSGCAISSEPGWTRPGGSPTSARTTNPFGPTACARVWASPRKGWPQSETRPAMSRCCRRRTTPTSSARTCPRPWVATQPTYPLATSARSPATSSADWDDHPPPRGHRPAAAMPVDPAHRSPPPLACATTGVCATMVSASTHASTKHP